MRRLTIWRMVSGPGSCDGSMTSMPSKPIPSCSTSGRLRRARTVAPLRFINAHRNTRVIRRTIRAWRTSLTLAHTGRLPGADASTALRR